MIAQGEGFPVRSAAGDVFRSDGLKNTKFRDGWSIRGGQHGY
jgi:hypothetical protein